MVKDGTPFIDQDEARKYEVRSLTRNLDRFRRDMLPYEIGRKDPVWDFRDGQIIDGEDVRVVVRKDFPLMLVGKSIGEFPDSRGDNFLWRVTLFPLFTGYRDPDLYTAATLSPRKLGVDLRDSVYGTYYLGTNGEILRLYCVEPEEVGEADKVFVSFKGGPVILTDRLDNVGAIDQINAVRVGIELFDKPAPGRLTPQKLNLIS